MNGKKSESYPNSRSSLGEVWRAYRAIGTESPIDLDPAILRRQAILAEHAVVPNKRTKQGQNMLLGSIHYELGIGLHGKDNDAASQSFAESLRHVHALEPASPEDLIRQQSWISIIDLMLSRTEAPEQRDRDLRIRTVQNFGRLLVAGAEVTRQIQDYRERSVLYGAVMESAFTGTFLADLESPRIGLPTTARQKSPVSFDFIPHRQATNGALRSSAVDLNILGYGAVNAAPVSSVPAQIESKDHGHERYKLDILMLYGTRDLSIGNLGDLHSYGENLSNFDGTPTMRLDGALDKIGAALERHQQQVSQKSRPIVHL